MIMKERLAMVKYRKMLNNWDAIYVQKIVKLMESQSKLTIIKWALNYSYEHLLPIWLRSYPEDNRPLEALVAASNWVDGEIKLPESKKIILNCHKASREKEDNPAAQASARAIAQAASSIHVPRLAIGLVFYGLLAVVYDKYGHSLAFNQVEKYAELESYNLINSLQNISIKNEINPAKFNWKC